jgi:hypothetical protein
MGTLRGDNGGGRPPDGGGLPDLPPEWGTIVIPDDAAALDHEATAIRRELRRRNRHNRWRRRCGLPPLRHRPADDDTPALGLPLLIMSIAIIATLTSLFAIAWPGRAGTGGERQPAAGGPPATSGTSVPDVTLHEAAGPPVRLRELLPAVVLLVDGCACAPLIADTAKAVDAQVTVLVVGRTLPVLPASLPQGRDVRAVTDAGGALHTAFGGSPGSAGVTALLINRAGGIVTEVPDVLGVENFRGYLNQLT